MGRMKRGEIYKLQREGGILTGGILTYEHFFAYWEDCGKNYHGVMITHGTDVKFANNIALREEHIKPGYYFHWDNSYFVAHRFIKDIPKRKLIKCGELTEDGISFIESKIEGMPTDTYIEYIKRLAHPK
nr:hypothetical protein [uncultured Bacteroides sp.]